MAGVLNKTARQYNLIVRTKKGSIVKAFIAPGLNVIPDEHWAFLKSDKETLKLKKAGVIEFGDDTDDLEMTRDPDTAIKSSFTPAQGSDETADGTGETKDETGDDEGLLE